MDLPASQTSDDGIYGLVDLSPPAPPSPPVIETAPLPPAVAADPPPPKPEPAPTKKAKVKAKAAKAPKGPGLFAKLGGKFSKTPPNPDASAAEPQNDKANPEKKAPAEPAGPRLTRRKRKVNTLKFQAPAWLVSLLIHVGVIGTLAVAGLSPEVQKAVKNLNASMVPVDTSISQAEELVHVYAEPSNSPRDMATATITVGGVGTGPPSATPTVGVSTNVGERTSLPSIKSIPKLSGLAMLPSGGSIARDLSASNGGGGMIAGDVTYESKDVGQALDQIAREVLRHLEKHKLTVVWLFDESGSMKDDQQAIKDKFSRISTELKVNVDESRKSANALTHVIVGFGDAMHVEQAKPTADIDLIGKAIDRLKVDETGTENTLQAIPSVVNMYGKMPKDRRMLIVLVTDESGDDGTYVEEARTALVSRGIPLYVIGRQSLFGYDRAHLLYVDPVTKDQYWPTIKRGPESAGPESLQYDGLHDRWDEQPSGFAPYELARLAKDSGGIYFLLPSEENMRVRQREKAYSIQFLKEYVPGYEARAVYEARRNKSELHRTMFQIIEETKSYGYRRHFPIEYGPLEEAILAEVPIAQKRLVSLLSIEKRLRSLEKLRDRDPDKRFQAHYDLMLAQIVAYQVKGYEYLACIDEMVALAKKGQLKPKTMPVPGQLQVEWQIDHSTDHKAPKHETEKKYAEAKRLLELVIKRHPKTPWADLAQDEINRGFGCQRNEWHHSPQYDERAKLVPKY
jgi:hypothetical protein